MKNNIINDVFYEKHKVIYMIEMNLTGLHTRIYRLTSGDYYGYWDKSGNIGFMLDDKMKLGSSFSKDKDMLYYISPIKSEVEKMFEYATNLTRTIREMVVDQKNHLLSAEMSKFTSDFFSVDFGKMIIDHIARRI